MHAIPMHAKFPAKWIGATVETTGSRRGVVQYSTLRPSDNVLELDVQDAYTGEMFQTDDEHATQVRSPLHG